MTQGRLYKSARATGAMADEAILALPERVSRPGDARAHNDQSTVAPAHDALAEARDSASAAVPAVIDGEAAHLPASELPGGAGLDSGQLAPAAGAVVSAAASSAAVPNRPDVTDYDHIFADPSINIAEAEDDLFPWDSATADAPAVPGRAGASAHSAPSGMSAGAAPMSAGAAPMSASGMTAAAASAAAQPTRIKVDGPSGVVEGTNNPVSTYLAKAPNIRLTFSGAVAAIAVVTVGLGLVEALLSDHIGMVTAIISVATALAATWFVSDRDRNVPALALPVAWLACALLPGQLTAPPSGSVALKQVVVVLGVLGDNALFILVGSLACYVLARLRSRLVADQRL
ncbi:MAG: hypothetical protein KGP01_07200 [Actinomycetales bacterium]|nr:hypothetical protein [Actinomycetales bacterium]